MAITASNSVQIWCSLRLVGSDVFRISAKTISRLGGSKFINNIRNEKPECIASAEAI
jgi:hypothetical protein